MRRIRLSAPVISKPRHRLRSLVPIAVLSAMAVLGSLASGGAGAAATVSADAPTAALANAVVDRPTRGRGELSGSPREPVRAFGTAVPGAALEFLPPILVPLAVHERNGRHRVLGREPRWPGLHP